METLERIEGAALFRVMADSSPVMLWMSGLDARCYYFNQPWLAFTGRTLEQEQGEGWVEGVHQEDFAYCIDTYMAAFRERRPFRMEYRLRRHDGEYRWILDTGRPYHTNTGLFHGYIGSCVDITDIVEARRVAIDKARLEAQLTAREETAALLELKNRELDAFADAVAHDLKAPLRQIQSFADLLSEELDGIRTEPIDLALNGVKLSCAAADRLVRDLLDYARAAGQPMQHSKIEMAALARQVWIEVARVRKSGELELSELPFAHADPRAIRQVLANLLDNAVKFSRPGVPPQVRAGYRDTPRGSAYFVADNGIGFDPQRAAQIFAPFVRCDATAEGTGLGLALVKRIIERHGGQLWAEGLPGQGATFYFSLPADAAESKATQHVA